MRALTVVPGEAHRAAVEDVAEPERGPSQLLVSMLAIGICGTDRDIIAGRYGKAPDGEAKLILGHESLGRVLEAPSAGDIRPGDWVVGIVRRPDPLPCASCGAGEWDMCENGQYTEHGIVGVHGFAAERCVLDPGSAVKLPAELGDAGVLLEPTSVVAKAWEQIEHVSARYAAYRPKRVLVTGAGPIGLLAALIGVLRGYEVHVLDRATEGVKPELVRDIGATFHNGSISDMSERPQIVVECTGADSLIGEALRQNARNGIVCLTGLSSGTRKLTLAASEFNNGMVLENDVVFGSVNANRRHYQAAIEALSLARPGWLKRLITRRVPLEDWRDALEQRADDVKVVLEISKDSSAAA